MEAIVENPRGSCAQCCVGNIITSRHHDGPSALIGLGHSTEYTLTTGLPYEIDQIDAKPQEIKPSSDETYNDLLELADDLPDSSPRFVLLSYPLTLVRPRQPLPPSLLLQLTAWSWCRPPGANPCPTSCCTTCL